MSVFGVKTKRFRKGRTARTYYISRGGVRF